MKPGIAAVAAIKDHVAFYPDRVDEIEEQQVAIDRKEQHDESST